MPSLELPSILSLFTNTVTKQQPQPQSKSKQHPILQDLQLITHLTPDSLQSLKQFHESMFPVKYNETFYESLLQQNSIIYGLQTQQGEHIGWITSRITEEPESPNSNSHKNKNKNKSSYNLIKKGYIMTLGISPHYQNQGLASFLLNLTLKHLLKSVSKIELDVMIHNEKAIGLYKKYGFRIMSLEKGYYSLSSGVFDSYHMVYEDGLFFFSGWPIY